MALDAISTPTENTNISDKQQGVNMAESHVASVLDQLQPGVDLWSQIIRLGRSLINRLMDGVTCQHWIQNLVIEMLYQPLKCLS